MMYDRIGRQQRLYGMVIVERNRQDDKWGWPNAGLAGTDDNRKLAILAEEFGEVARAILEHDRTNMHDELVQCAAVCLAWLESEAEQGALTV